MCTKCGEDIKLSEAHTKNNEKTILVTKHEKHALQLELLKKYSMNSIAETVEP